MIKFQTLCTVIVTFCVVFSNRMNSLQRTISANQSKSNEDLEKMILEQTFLNTMQSTFLSLVSTKTRKLEVKYNMLLRKTEELKETDRDIQNLTKRMNQFQNLEGMMETMIGRIDHVEEEVKNITRNVKYSGKEWTTYNGVNYYFSTYVAEWEKARMNCRQLGDKIYLVRIPSADINAFLISAGNNGRYWTGGNDITEEGKWVWGNEGKSFTYVDWRPGEPNNTGEIGEEDCLMLYTDSTNRKHWNDAECSQPLRYICQSVEN